MKFKLFFLSFLSSFLFIETGFSLENNLKVYDISILYPLPVQILNNFLLKPQDQEKFGELIPKRYYSQLPNLGEADPEVIFKHLNVVAIRLDPCVPRLTMVETCKAQIRFVWQPINDLRFHGITTGDLAVHSFYDISAADLDFIFSEISGYKSKFFKAGEGRSLVSSFANNRLQVHPILSFEGLSGPFAFKLRKLLLNSVGESKMTKLTFMRNLGSGIWNFGGFDIRNGILTVAKIPHLGQPEQYYYNSSKSKTDFVDGGPVPAVSEGDQFTFLVSDSENAQKYSDLEIADAVKAAAKIENPLLHNPNTVDCVGCHTAQMARIWAIKNRPNLNWEQVIAPVTYKSDFDLANPSPDVADTTVLRSFGYFGKNPVFSQRVINESAECLKLIQIK